MYKHLKSKVFASLTMLIVAAVVLATVGYAWYSISTAPEISNIEAKIASNENLEILLDDGYTEYSLPSVDEGDNGNPYKWGNLVDLSKASTNNARPVELAPVKYVDGSLCYPTYGDDGRIITVNEALLSENVSAYSGFGANGGYKVYYQNSSSATSDALGITYWLRSNEDCSVILADDQTYRADDSVNAAGTVNAVQGSGSYIEVDFSKEQTAVTTEVGALASAVNTDWQNWISAKNALTPVEEEAVRKYNSLSSGTITQEEYDAWIANNLTPAQTKENQAREALLAEEIRFNEDIQSYDVGVDCYYKFVYRNYSDEKKYTASEAMNLYSSMSYGSVSGGENFHYTDESSKKTAEESKNRYINGLPDYYSVRVTDTGTCYSVSYSYSGYYRVIGNTRVWLSYTSFGFDTEFPYEKAYNMLKSLTIRLECGSNTLYATPVEWVYYIPDDWLTKEKSYGTGETTWAQVVTQNGWENVAMGDAAWEAYCNSYVHYHPYVKTYATGYNVQGTSNPEIYLVADGAITYINEYAGDDYIYGFNLVFSYTTSGIDSSIYKSFYDVLNTDTSEWSSQAQDKWLVNVEKPVRNNVPEISLTADDPVKVDTYIYLDGLTATNKTAPIFDDVPININLQFANPDCKGEAMTAMTN